MIAHLIAGTKRIFGLHRPGRNLLILPDDVFIVSYPKSGNTWARFLIANLTRPGEHVDFSNIDKIIADVTSTTKRQFGRMSRPRLIKSHGCFDPRFRRVIYIVRDPRDVAVSEYHYQRKTRRINDDHPIDEYVSRFITGETYENDGSWGEHVVSWIATSAHHPRFLLLRYEDLIANTVRELRRVDLFLGYHHTTDQLSEAAAQSSANRMRKLEEKQSDLLSLTRGSRKEIPFVRAAKSGNWKSDLPPTSIEKIEAAWGRTMRFLGYELLYPLKASEQGLDLRELVLRGPSK